MLRPIIHTMNKQARILMFLDYVNSKPGHERKALMLKWDECGLARRGIYLELKKSKSCMGRDAVKGLMLEVILGGVK